MIFIKKNAVIALALVGLYGCNSGSDESGEGPGKPPATISVKDASFSASLSSENYYVDLTNSVLVSDNSDFIL
uniref:hypothetical protein n=1 Tax=Shewanella algae TaxID=38313 RepID=UPI001F20B92E